MGIRGEQLALPFPAPGAPVPPPPACPAELRIPYEAARPLSQENSHDHLA